MQHSASMSSAVASVTRIPEQAKHDVLDGIIGDFQVCIACHAACFAEACGLLALLPSDAGKRLDSSRSSRERHANLVDRGKDNKSVVVACD